MSRHLSPEEFVDAIDGVLDAQRRAHLERCAECRREIDALGILVHEMPVSDEPPAPSPLFWDHFPGRVRAAASLAPQTAPSRWGYLWPAVAAASALVLVVSFALLRGSLTTAMPPVPPARVESAPPAIAPPAEAVASRGRAATPDAPLSDETSQAARRSWNRVVSAGRAASPEDVLGIEPAGPGTAVLIEDLSARELQEFARLLRAQMGGLQ